MNNNPIQELKWKKFLKPFLKVSAPTILLVILASILIYYSEVGLELSIAKEQLNLDITHLKERITDDFTREISDLMVLTDSNELNNFINNQSSKNKESLIQKFLSYSDLKTVYDQISLLDATGKEVIRVNYNKGESYITLEENLQFKGNKYYFLEVSMLEKSDVYISPLDLDIEGDNIREDEKPVIRFITPVYNTNNTKKGYLILNYFGDNIINSLVSSSTSYNNLNMLVNPDGYWLKGIKKSDELGFEYDDSTNFTFTNYFPDAWSLIQRGSSGEIMTTDGLFVFTTIYLQPANGGVYDWKLVSLVNAKLLNSLFNNIAARYVIIDIIIALLLLTFLWYVVRQSEKQRIAEKALEDYSKKLEKANRFKDIFTDIMRHDLLNPIGVINGYSNLLLEQETSNRKKKIIKRIEGATSRAIEMIKNAATYSKLESMKGFECIDGDLNILFKASVVDLKNRLAEKKVKLVYLPKGEYPVCANPMLKNVFANLVSNAIKYGYQGGKIEVNITDDEKHWVVSVKDWGPGISNEGKRKLFTRFERLGKKDAKGTGLGLTIAKQIVKLHKGELWVDDNPAGGTVFYVSLPKK